MMPYELSKVQPRKDLPRGSGVPVQWGGEGEARRARYLELLHTPPGRWQGEASSIKYVIDWRHVE